MLTKAISSTLNEKVFDACWNYLNSANEDHTGDEMYSDCQFILSTVVIFRENHQERNLDIKKCTSGDYLFVDIGETSYSYALSKYVIVEYVSEKELDESMLARQIRIDINFDV